MSSIRYFLFLRSPTSLDSTPLQDRELSPLRYEVRLRNYRTALSGVVGLPHSHDQEPIVLPYWLPFSPPASAQDEMHPTLSRWLQNMKKLSSLIDRLEELASSVPENKRYQLSRKVATLRATFKKQQERCIDFLQLSEEYADKYLLNISAEIRQQSSFLDMLEKRLDMAKTLRQQAVDLRRSYESGTVATMKDVRTTGKTPRNPVDCKDEILRLDSQHCRSHFPRISIYLVRWTSCLARFGNVTWKWTSFGGRRYAMLLEHWKCVVLTRGMSSAGRIFMQALKKLLIRGRYDLLYCRFVLPTSQNTFFRMGRRVVVPRIHAAEIHSLLRFVHSFYYFGIPIFDLVFSRGRISGRLPRPYHPQWVRSKIP